MKRRNFENKKLKKLFVFGHTFKGDGPVVAVSRYIRNNYYAYFGSISSGDNYINSHVYRHHGDLQ